MNTEKKQENRQEKLILVMTALSVVMVAIAGVALINHTFILRELCANEIIEDSTGETIGAFLDGQL